MSNPEPPPSPRHGKIVISPALSAWIQRTPSRRVAVHRDRYRSAPTEPTEVEPPTDVGEEPADG